MYGHFSVGSCACFTGGMTNLQPPSKPSTEERSSELLLLTSGRRSSMGIGLSILPSLALWKELAEVLFSLLSTDTSTNRLASEPWAYRHLSQLHLQEIGTVRARWFLSWDCGNDGVQVAMMLTMLCPLIFLMP